MNGMSKKLCISIIGVHAIIAMAADSEDKLPYAIIVAGLCVIYKLTQGFIDWKRKD